MSLFIISVIDCMISEQKSEHNELECRILEIQALAKELDDEE